MKNKILGSLLITFGLFSILTVILLGINASVAKCIEGHYYDSQRRYCYYESNNCLENQQIAFVQGKQICTYHKVGFMNSLIIWLIILFFFASWFGIYQYWKNKKEITGTIDFALFDKKDSLMADTAIDLWKLWYAKRNGLLIINGDIPEDVMHDNKAREVSQFGKEWFCKFQVDVQEGNEPGLYTVTTSLSRGKEWILGGMASFAMCTYGEYQRSKGWKMWTPEDPRERLLEKLYDDDPEQALDIQKQLLLKGIRGDDVYQQNQNVQQPDMPRQQPTVIQKNQPRYNYRRPVRMI